MTHSDSSSPRVKIAEVIPFMRQMRSRMPFRFGKTVMTGMPVIHLRIRLEDQAGRSFEGWSACGVVSMWFDKDYTKSESKREADLLYSVYEAVNGYISAGIGTAWDLHQQAEPGVRERLEAAGLNGLTAGYGIALVDSAIIDAICRRESLPFHQGLKANLLGFDPELVSALPAHPTQQMALRHTVGLGDPLSGADVDDRLNDGLPQTLEEVISQYGTTFFKIKVNNDVEQSMDRLKAITSILDASGKDYRATLDGNEAFPDMESFREFVEACASSAELSTLWNRVLWFEQPVARQRALEPGVADALKVITQLKPVIIDESDDDDSALDRALSLGYKGISAKNCKGVFRTLKSYLAVARAPANAGLVLSSEDLTNQPIVPNHQDLCVAASLAISHSERNGHHFFKGFAFLSDAERKQALDDYPDLYETTPDGTPTLRFTDGKMSMAEINSSPGLGVKSHPDWSSLEPLELPEKVQ